MRSEEIILRDQNENAEERATGFAETLILPLLRSKYLLALCVGAGFLSGIAYSASSPPSFESNGKILVRLGDREQRATDLVTEERTITTSTRVDDLRTELHLLQSPDVFEEVVTGIGAERLLERYRPSPAEDGNAPLLQKAIRRVRMWFARDPDANEPREKPSEARLRSIAATVLSRRAAIKIESFSRVISVSYEHHDAELTRDIVAAFLQAFQRKHQRVYSTESSFEFLTTERQKAAEAVSEAELELREFVEECGITDLNAQQTELLARQAGLESQLQSDRQQLASLEARLAYLKVQLTKYEPIQEMITAPTEMPNTVWLATNAQLDGLLVRRGELSVRFAEDSDPVRAVDLAISDIKERLKTISPTTLVRGAVREMPNPAYARIQAGIEQEAIEETGLVEAIRMRKRHLEEDRSELAKIQQCEPRILLLESTVELLRQKARALASRLEDYKVANTLDQLNATNLLVVQDASLALEPTGPNSMKYLLVFTAAGLIGGAGLAFVRNSLNHSVRRPEEVELRLGIRILASVPEYSAWRRPR